MGLEQLYTSGCNEGAAVEADAIWGAAAEAGAFGEQELKRTQLGSSSRRGRNRGTVEVDAIGEQLKSTQLESSS